MSKIRPFAALRPSFSNAPDVACLPYDVMDRQEAAEMAEENPKSFLRIVRSEIELPGVDAYDERVYEKAKENLLALRLLAKVTYIPKLSFYCKHDKNP